MFSSLLVLSLAALAPLAQATVFITAPVATTNVPAGKPFTITWEDDGTAPPVSSFGPASFALYVGNVDQQTLLQPINGSVDVSKASSISWTPDASVGPNSGVYFLRVTSLTLADPSTPGFNYEAFSAKFTLSGMTGTFNSTEESEISSSLSPSSAAGATAAAATGSGPTTSSSSAPAASTVKASSAAATTAADSSKSNGAGHMVVPGVLGATGVAAIVFAFFI